jgi:hypothetical protein
VRRFGRAHRDSLAGLAALLGPLLLAVTLLPWRGGLPNTDVALVLVAVVVAVAANGHRGAGILAAAGSAIWFDFFWTVPYERLTITRHTDMQTTVLVLAVGAAVSELAARTRRARRTVRADAAYLAAMGSTSGLVAAGRPVSEVVDQVTVQLMAVLALQAARFQIDAIHGRPPRLDADGELRWGHTHWDIDQFGWPSEPAELPVRSGGRVVGRFVLAPIVGAAPSAQARQAAVVLADQVGAALAGRGVDQL